MMHSIQSVTQRQIANVRLEQRAGKTRNPNGSAHTPEETEALGKKMEALLKKREEAKDMKRQKIIKPINEHSTSQASRVMTHQTDEAHGIKDAFIQGLSLATGKNVGEMMMVDDFDKLKKDQQEAMASRNMHYDRARRMKMPVLGAALRGEQR